VCRTDAHRGRDAVPAARSSMPAARSSVAAARACRVAAGSPVTAVVVKTGPDTENGPFSGGEGEESPMAAAKPPFPPFTEETAPQKVQAAEDAWNTRDPERVALAYTEDSVWRNRDRFVTGREEIVAFLRDKWARELDYALRDELAAIDTPVLVLVGDEDEGCLETDLMLKRTIPTAGLAVLPQTGHTANLEEPDAFNGIVDRFLAAAERDGWRRRDPRSQSTSTTGMAAR